MQNLHISCSVDYTDTADSASADGVDKIDFAMIWAVPVRSNTIVYSTFSGIRISFRTDDIRSERVGRILYNADTSLIRPSIIESPFYQYEFIHDKSSDDDLI